MRTRPPKAKRPSARRFWGLRSSDIAPIRYNPPTHPETFPHCPPLRLVQCAHLGEWSEAWPVTDDPRIWAAWDELARRPYGWDFGGRLRPNLNVSAEVPTLSTLEMM